MKTLNDKYKIYHFDTNGNEVEDFVFNAASRDEAYAIYFDYVKSHDGDINFKYKRLMIFNILHDDGTTTEEEFLANDDEPKTFFKKNEDFCVGKWYSLTRKYQNLRYFFKELRFWLKNYNMEHCTSHMNSECWSLDIHILNDLKFNIPRIKEIASKGGGIPTKYTELARMQLKATSNEKYVIPQDIINSHSYTTDEFKLAEKLWINELDFGFDLICRYCYYLDYGIIDPNNPIDVEMEKKYKHTIPYYPGTTTDIDYEKFHEVVEKAWNDVWMWFTENGRDLWT